MCEHNRPTVDIVVNNCNYGRFVAGAIQSALDQTYDAVRVVVVDDGSTDESQGVIESFDGRVLSVLKENGGQASAFNAGLERSDGDVVVFLDADDLLLPDAAARIAEAYRRQPNLARVQFRMLVVDENGRPTGDLKPPAHIPLPSGDLQAQALASPFDLARPPTSGNAFSRRALSELLPIRDCGRGFHADWYIVHNADLLGPVVAIEQPLAAYRVHGGNRHELRGTSLDLDHLRVTIEVTAATRRYLEATTARLGLGSAPGSSMCEIADRLISRRLAPKEHPIASDTLPRLLWLGRGAVRGRPHVARGIKLVYLTWLVAVAVAPRRLARVLGEMFVFPSRRAKFNRWLVWLRGTG